MRLAQDEHAWTRGFEDGELGLPLRACPYDIGSTESWSWSSGYVEGKAARNGYAVTRPAPNRQEKRAPATEAAAVPLRSTAAASVAEETKEKGVNIARRSGVKVRRRLTPWGLGVLVSCVGRKLLLGQRVSEETEAVAEALGSTPVIGFYSYGEICHHAVTQECNLHNQTMTVTLFGEK